MLQTVARWVREQSSSDGKRRLSRISRIPPRDYCLITAGVLIAEATKLIFTTFSLISLTREQVLHCGDWRHPSGVARAASGWILALRNWGWFIPCKMQVADTKGSEADAQALLCCRRISMTKGQSQYLWEFKPRCSPCVLEESWQARTDHLPSSMHQGLRTPYRGACSTSLQLSPLPWWRLHVG